MNDSSSAAATSSSSTATMMDGLSLDSLRSLASDSGNLSNLFYAQLLHAKTGAPTDALLLARVYLQHGQAAACFRTLEDAQLLGMGVVGVTNSTTPSSSSESPSSSSSTTLFWSALEVAVTALAATEDWTLLQQLVQDLMLEFTSSGLHHHHHHPLPLPSTHNNHNASWFGVVTPVAAASHPSSSEEAPPPAEADLVEALLPPPLPSNTTSSTPDDRCLASRVWYWRAKAHWELGDPLLATEHWCTSLQWDARNQAAWNALMALQLLSPQQSLDLIRSLNPIEGWLRALYVAQIPVTTRPPLPTQPPKRPSVALGETPGVGPTSRESLGLAPSNDDEDLEDFFGDASSIQLVSPWGRLRRWTPTASSTPHLSLARDPPTTPAPEPKSASSHQPGASTEGDEEANSALASSSCHDDIRDAFEQLRQTYKLGHSPHVLALAARRAYNGYDWKNCLQLCEQLAAMGSIVPSSSNASSSAAAAAAASAVSTSSYASSSASDAAYCYIAVLVLLGRHRSLFQLAHEWVSAAPKSPQSWFAVGAYYYSTGRYHVAQRHFCRATRLDPQCSAAWMAFGCSFAMVDESDQALASFRAAQRLAPGDALPLLYMGVEYVRTNHLTLAQHFLHAARVQSQDDPLCLHELGVLELHKGRLDAAVQWFTRALLALHPPREGEVTPHNLETALAECSDPFWEPTIFNLGHAHRRARRFELAQLCFERCLALTRSSSAYAALAFTIHLRGELDTAISLYHQALAGKPDDPFASEMLTRALRENLLQGLDDDWIPPVLPTPRTAGPGGAAVAVALSSLPLRLVEDPSSPPTMPNETMDQTGSDMDSDVDMSG